MTKQQRNLRRRLSCGLPGKSTRSSPEHISCLAVPGRFEPRSQPCPARTHRRCMAHRHGPAATEDDRAPSPEEGLLRRERRSELEALLDTLRQMLGPPPVVRAGIHRPRDRCGDRPQPFGHGTLLTRTRINLRLALEAKGGRDDDLHRRPLELAGAAVDFELSPHEREELDRHLAGCSHCRSRIDGLRRDALAIEALPILPVTTERSARLREATLARRDRSAWPALRPRRGGGPPRPARPGRRGRRIFAVRSGRGPALRRRTIAQQRRAGPGLAFADALEPGSHGVGDCRNRPAMSPPLRLSGSVGSGASANDRHQHGGPRNRHHPTITSELVTTCSTVMPSDFAEVEPEEADWFCEGQAIDVAVEEGWQILHWEGFDRPRDSEGTNVIPGGSPEDRPSSITLPVPEREGDVIVGLTIWAQTVDGRVVANVSTTVWLRIEPRVVGRPTPAGGALNVIPASVSCNSVGWPDDAPRYRTVTFRIDREAPGYVSAVTDTGAELEVLWAQGFQSRTWRRPHRSRPDGDVVAADGETFDIPDNGSLPDLHGYRDCVRPSD